MTSKPGPRKRPARVSEAENILRSLTTGEITSCLLLPRGSNYTFLVTVLDDAGNSFRGVYKPADGERPLWDFPYGSLGRRERAAYLLAEALEWHFIPPTVLREGPHGFGSVQLFVEHDPEHHYFTLKDEFTEDFQRLFAFDWLANNADRKAGHCLKDLQNKIWGIDNSLTFHERHKLRTVIWDFAGQPIPEVILSDLAQLGSRLERTDGPLLAELGDLLEPEEMFALQRRLETMLERRRFLETHEGGVPWPWL
ncbi:MAG TPA: SCO1664 family protein [Dehalococcoidia bacterium]|nr:SCO1664 family protein [Dehalococcoidia bacterium]